MGTKITDSFGRANENPLASPYVKTASGFTGDLKLASNAVSAVSSGTDSWFYDNSNTYDANSQWAVFTVGAAGAKDFGVVLHMTSTGSGYFMTGASAPGKIQLFKVVTGSFGSFILDIPTQTYTAADQFYLENVAGAIKLYRGTDSSGTLIGSVTDGTPLTGGKPGMGSNDSTGTFSFFSAGDFTASGNVVTPGAGSLALSGLAPTVISPLVRLPPAGTLALAGQDPQLATPIIGVGWNDPNDTWSYVGGRGLVGGTQPSFVVGFVPAAASLVLAGLSPTIVVSGGGGGGGTTVTPGAGALVLAGLAPAAVQDSTRTPGAGALVLAGLAPAAIQNSVRTPGAGALALAGLAPAAVQDSTRTPGAGTLTLTGLAPSLLQAITVLPGTGALVLAGLAPTVLQNIIVQPGAGALTLAGQQPAVLNGAAVVAQPPAGAMTLAGLAPTAVQTTNATPVPGTGALVLAGFAPTISTADNRTAAPGAGTLTLAGLAPTITVSANALPAPQAGALALAGMAPTSSVSDNQVVQPGVGALALAGLAPVVPVQSPTVSPGPGALALAGLAPTVVTTGDNVLDAKFLGRPNVRVKPLRDLMPKPQPPLPAQVTNMPDAPPPTLARGVDLGLLPISDAAEPAPKPRAAPVPAPALKAPPPPLEPTDEVVKVPAPLSPAPPPAEAPAAEAPAAETPKPDPHAEALAGLATQVSAAQMGIEALLAQVQELRSQLDEQQRKRALETKNALRAQELTRRILQDLMNQD